MIPGPLIAEIAGLVGEPARATMLSALLDGRALTATELANAARVTPQTASTHLAKLAEAGLVVRIRDGRYRYFRLASPRVAEMLDGIMGVALENRPRYRPLSRQARELSAARICYDHLAGRLSVDLTDSLIARGYIAVDDEAAEITQAGTRFLTEFGVDLAAASSKTPSLLPTMHRLDRTTATHRGRGRGRTDETVLRSRLDGEDEARRRGDGHRVGEARFPGNLRHRRARGGRERSGSLAFWQPSLACSLDNPLELLAEGWIVGSS